MSDNRKYLGDGVYVDFDGYQVALSTDNGIDVAIIYLEPEVLAALIQWVKEHVISGA